MKRVLILDNDEDVLDVMQEALVYEGLQVTCAGRTNDIFQLIDAHKPDVLMMDYLLNGTDGGELCRQVKENPKTHDLPVIIISAYPRLRMSPGTEFCDDFIPKPFDLDDLTERIKKLTKRKRSLHAI